MVPVVFIVVGCVCLVLAAAVYVYRRRAAVHASGDSDDDDDDDVADESGVRTVAETAALMDGEDDSLRQEPTRRRSVQNEDHSLLGYLVSFFRTAEKTKPTKNNNLMHRRNKGVKKIHKPYFYPLLDETAQWFADWESKKQQSTNLPSEVTDVRIAKSNLDATQLISPHDLLDGLDCVPLVSFRPSTHTIIPVAAI